jgi:two-component system CheB/CheR fusion protein
MVVHRFKPQPQATPKRRVLVVDDNLDAVQSMAFLLKTMGHEVQFAINGLAAIEVARKFRPQIILLDLGLPDFDGDHIACQLKFEPGMEETRIIAVTGRSDEEAKRRALEVGCEAFYVKPVAPTVLEELLAK